MCVEYRCVKCVYIELGIAWVPLFIMKDKVCSWGMCLTWTSLKSLCASKATYKHMHLQGERFMIVHSINVVVLVQWPKYCMCFWSLVAHGVRDLATEASIPHYIFVKTNQPKEHASKRSWLRYCQLCISTSHRHPWSCNKYFWQAIPWQFICILYNLLSSCSCMHVSVDCEEWPKLLISCKFLDWSNTLIWYIVFFVKRFRNSNPTIFVKFEYKVHSVDLCKLISNPNKFYLKITFMSYVKSFNFWAEWYFNCCYKNIC
jgi:hypothetical protein